MKRIIKYIICFFVATALLSACGKQSQEITTTEDAETADASLYGTWGEDMFDSGFVFNADGTGKDTFWDLDFTYKTMQSGAMVISYNDEMYGETDYTYSVNGNTLTMTLSEDGSVTEYTKR